MNYAALSGNKWNYEKFISYREMLDKIQSEFAMLEKIEDHPNDTSKVLCVILVNDFQELCLIIVLCYIGLLSETENLRVFVHFMTRPI